MRDGGQFEDLLNPKPEIRMPKEIRNPKSETRSAGDALGFDSEFWTWGDESPNSPMLLHDGELTSRPDLMERTALSGEAIIRFAKIIPHTAENTRLISQLVGAGT